MEHLTDRLRTQVERIRQLSQAAGASVFLPSPWPGATLPLLLHTGDAPPIAELETLDSAQQFHRRHLDADGPDAATADPADGPERKPGAVVLPVPCATRLTAVPNLARAAGRRQSDNDPVPLAGWLGLRFACVGGADTFGASDPRARRVAGVGGLARRMFVTMYPWGLTR